MSHRLSQAARHTQELLEDLERDKELDIIRVYLTRLNLFPRQRDPRTAPIRSEELRDLVKHWKLHRQRNFWKNHTTKEDLVRTLYKHINTKVLPNEKNPLPLQQEPPMTPTPPPMVPVAPSPTRPYSAGTDSPAKRRVSRLVSPVKVNEALDPYGGDLFGQRGDYHSGMIYVSRLAKPEKPSVVETDLQNLLDQNKPATLTPELEILDEDAAQRERRLMAECACSLYQLTMEPGHETSIVLEGCIPAIVQLCNYDDLEVKKYCSATIVNVSVDHALCARMIDEGVLSGLMELAKVQQEDIRRNAAIGICRISYERHGQHRLIQEGSVPALISMLNNTDFETKEACVKTLVNIASFSGGNVSESVISTVIRIAAKKDPAYDRFIIETICNLSLLTGSRLKAPDDGILDPIPGINQTCNDLNVQTMIAMALSNFSGIDTNHHLMATPALLGALDGLLKLDDDTIKEMATTAAANLSTSRDAIPVIMDSALPTRLIATGYTPRQSIQENVTLAIANLALSDEANGLVLVEKGLVPLLLQLFAESSTLTRYNAMVALCTLMQHAGSRAELIAQDSIHVVIGLAASAELKLRELCAIGLFNFSCYEDFAELTLQPDVLEPMIRLFTSSGPAIGPKEEKEIVLSAVQEHCLNFLYNLSFYPQSRGTLVQATTVAACCAVFRKVAKTPEFNTRAAVTIANLTFCADGHPQMLAEDVLRVLRRLSAATSATKELLLASATALCNLAVPGVLHAGQTLLDLLIDLSHTPQADIALACSLAYSKLAADVALREVLSKCVELPPTLVVMMRSGIEEIQIHCAAALCGMACERGPRSNKHMWKEGTVSDFIVNSLLRINSDSTKEVCAKVLFNVLTHDDCRLAMIKDGVLYALIKLARLESLEIRALCITALYNLSCDPSMVPALMEANVPHVVSKMCDGEFRHEESRRKLSACLTNMALAPGMELKLMEGGVLNAVLVLCEHADLDCMRYGASVLCSVSMQPANCDGLASNAALEVLRRMVHSKDPPQVILAVNALCNVSCHAHLHDKIEEAETICAILHVVSDANEDEGIILTCAKVLCNMAFHAKHWAVMMKFHLIRTFIRVFANRPIYKSVADVLARIVATLSDAHQLVEAMVGEGAVQLLRMAAVDASPGTVVHCIVSLTRLSRGGHSGTRILDDGLFDILAAAVPLGDGTPRLAPDISERCSMILRTLSTYTMCIPQMIQDARLMPLIQALAAGGDKESCKNCVMLLHNITAARDRTFQKGVRISGVIPLLIRLAKVGSSEDGRICAVALAHINCELSEADRREIEEYEPGVVATMISMLDMDPPAMQRAEKLATSLPPLLPWSPKEKDWVFLFGENAPENRLPQSIPVAWTIRDDTVDGAKLVPNEPQSFVSHLPQQHCEFTSTIKDALYGSFQILMVSSAKSRLKGPVRLAHMSVNSVLKAFDHSSLTPVTATVSKPPTPPVADEPEEPVSPRTPRNSSLTRAYTESPKEDNSPRKASITAKKHSHRVVKGGRTSSRNAARHTQELLQDLERDKELDVLRVYLTRYNLFPRKRDPRTAPIRAEELRDLVKHWKLHRQRNFWKSHTTKEELVRTLYKHINTKVLPNESALVPSSSGVLPARPTTPSPAESKKAPYERRMSHRGASGIHILKQKLSLRNTSYSPDGSYSGDLFSQRGDYDDGMIYLSRMGTAAEHEMSASGPALSVNTSPETPTSAAVSHSSSTSSSTPTTPRHTDARIEINDEDASTREVRMKQECASSLYQLALQVGHEGGMVSEGCVPALVRLSLFDDNDVKKYCAAALVNLTCDPSLVTRMLDDGLLAGLMELSKLQHEDVRRNAAIGLCRGSYERLGQFRLLQEGSVPAMISMLNSTDYDTKEACLKTLINIASYAGATVSDTVIHALVKMAARKDPPSLLFVAEAMANLSVLTGPRVKAVEDGLLEPLADVCTSTASVEIKRLVATALCNFSGIETNHSYLSQLLVLRCVDVLLETPEELIRELTSVTVANLTCRPDALRSRITTVLAARLIQIGYMQNASIQANISLALANLVSSDRLFLTQHGVVPLVLHLLRVGSPQTQSHAVAVLCGLMEHETSRAELLQCDAIDAVLQLTAASSPSIRDFCALSFFNFSAHTDLAPYLLAPATLQTLLGLFRDGTRDDGKEPTIVLSKVQETCLNCLYNLSFFAPSRAGLVAEGAVACLLNVFRKPTKGLEPNKRCVAVLCNFTFCASSRERMLADDALRLLKRLMGTTTCKELLLSASSALCNLACPAMEQPNTPVLQMLMDLSHTAHADISLNCAIAFAKLAAAGTYSDVLARCAGLPPTLTVMMRSGIEEVQIHCATALCGLAAERGPRGLSGNRHLWREGTISDFIVNSLLRINSDSTKEICAKVLFNVLTHDDCRGAMIKEGVLYALVKLARLESLEIRILCVTALYNLSCDPALLSVLMEINVAQVIAKMCESDVNTDDNRQKLSACLANIALEEGHEEALVEGDVLNAVLLLCEHGGVSCKRFGASILCSLSMQARVCDAMATLSIVELLLQMIGSKDGPQVLFGLSALCNLSCAVGAHERLEEAETIAAVLRVLQSTGEELVLLTGVKVLHNLSVNSKFHANMIAAACVPTLLQILVADNYQSVADVAAEIVATLSEDANVVNQLVAEGAVRVLRCAAAHGGPRTVRFCVLALCRLSRGGFSGPRLVSDGLFDVIAAAVPLDGSSPSSETAERVALVLRTLSTYVACIPSLLHEERVVPILYALTKNRERETCRHCVMLLHNITAARNRAFQAQAKAAGVIPLLIMLSQVGASDIRQVSSVALAHLNSELCDGDDDYETGLVSTLISMLDMDPATMHTVEKLASAMPPPVKAQRTHPWNYLRGFRPTRVLLQLPVVWAVQAATVDDARLVPPEPGAFLAGLQHQAADLVRPIQDAVYGSYTIMRVSSEKCRLKPSPRVVVASPAEVLKKLDETAPAAKETVVRVAVRPPKPTKPRLLVAQKSFNATHRTMPHAPEKRGSASLLNLPKL
ncbi:hypothetical protein ACHHYP_00923 [Achlya hypogyna]|uniref:Vacuolar protein 8 n=1 Tax=Achlya hypogyna TaxID=1202772 RepID=A0A1V9ZA19_ACHHY|nr:hypothetical protein ACHHYP_00923 [Achlya hypogyna]